MKIQEGVVEGLHFFKMHEFKIFQSLEGSKNMGYSILPPENTDKKVTLRKSQLPMRPKFESKLLKIKF